MLKMQRIEITSIRGDEYLAQNCHGIEELIENFQIKP